MTEKHLTSRPQIRISVYTSMKDFNANAYSLASLVSYNLLIPYYRILLKFGKSYQGRPASSVTSQSSARIYQIDLANYAKIMDIH
jgi:hypothetical protein